MAGITITAVVLLVTAAHARLPEPPNIIYGMMPMGKGVISLQVNGVEVASYTLGENPDAGDYFILRAPIDALDPPAIGTTRPGDQAIFFFDGQQSAPLETVTIGEKGTIQEVVLLGSDGDGDTVAFSEDNCPAVANQDQADGDTDGVGDVCDNCIAVSNTGQQNSDPDNYGDACDNCITVANNDQNDANSNGQGDACDASDSDGDGYSDMLEYSYFISGHFDLDDNPYDPFVTNAPGDAGYVPVKDSFWILMLPAILSGSQAP